MWLNRNGIHNFLIWKSVRSLKCFKKEGLWSNTKKKAVCIYIFRSKNIFRLLIKKCVFYHSMRVRPNWGLENEILESWSNDVF